MRPNHQNHNNNQNRRMRGRNGNGNNNRKGPNPLTRSYESNGPDVKVRGTAQHVAEKYIQLARDAQSSGDTVMAESYLQHAEHYYRIIAAAHAAQQAQFGPRDDDRNGDADNGEDIEEENDRFAFNPPPGQRQNYQNASFQPGGQPYQNEDGSVPGQGQGAQGQGQGYAQAEPDGENRPQDRQNGERYGDRQNRFNNNNNGNRRDRFEPRRERFQNEQGEGFSPRFQNDRGGEGQPRAYQDRNNGQDRNGQDRYTPDRQAAPAQTANPDTGGTEPRQDARPERPRRERFERRPRASQDAAPDFEAGSDALPAFLTNPVRTAPPVETTPEPVVSAAPVADADAGSDAPAPVKRGRGRPRKVVVADAPAE